MPREKKKKRKKEKRQDTETQRGKEGRVDAERSTEYRTDANKLARTGNTEQRPKHNEGPKQTPKGGGGGNSHRTRGKERIREVGKVSSNRGRRPKKGIDTDTKRGERQNKRRGERPEKGRDTEGCGHRAALARFLESLRMILTKRGRLINLNQGDTVR